MISKYRKAILANQINWNKYEEQVKKKLKQLIDTSLDLYISEDVKGTNKRYQIGLIIRKVNRIDPEVGIRLKGVTIKYNSIKKLLIIYTKAFIIININKY